MLNRLTTSDRRSSPPSIVLSCTIVIDRPVEDVFDFVADPLNDPKWCPKIRSVSS